MTEQQPTINDLRERADALARDLTGLIKSVSDYDLERLLKKIDADLIDVRHNLSLATRLMGTKGQGESA